MKRSSVLSIAVFTVLSTFTGVGVAWMVIATIANIMNRTSGSGHVDAIVGGPGDALVGRSIPMLVAGGFLGFVAGLLGKATSEKRKLKAQQIEAPNERR
jgi:hypothetical protein